MNKIGPPLEALTHRLAETPYDILHATFIQTSFDKSKISITALINDFFVLHNLEPCRLLQSATEKHKLLALIALWLMQDRHFAQIELTDKQLESLFEQTLAELVDVTQPSKFTTEPDQREELARTILAHCDYRPQGETLSQAKDRLASLSSVERQRLIRESRAAEKRAREIREALAKKAAEASADKWTRE